MLHLALRQHGRELILVPSADRWREAAAQSTDNAAPGAALQSTPSSAQTPNSGTTALPGGGIEKGKGIQ